MSTLNEEQFRKDHTNGKCIPSSKVKEAIQRHLYNHHIGWAKGAHDLIKELGL